MKKTLIMVPVMALILSVQAYALDLNCKLGGTAVDAVVTESSINLDGNGGARETQDPDCAYRSERFACYEDGQFMFNVPLALLQGKVKNGVVYFQSDTGDNADSHNHALLGVPYDCVVK